MATQQQQTDFINNMSPYAIQAGGQLGVSPNVILAQWAHESAWGTSNLAVNQNNYGGITSGGGYASYASPADFANSYTSLLQNNYPQALNTGSDATGFVYGLQQGGYFTDSLSNYGTGVIGNLGVINAADPSLNTGAIAQGYGPSIDVGSQPYDPSLPLGVPGSEYTPYGSNTLSGFNFNLPGSGLIAGATGLIPGASGLIPGASGTTVQLSPQTEGTIGNWIGGILDTMKNTAERWGLILVALVILFVALWHVMEPSSSPIRHIA